MEIQLESAIQICYPKTEGISFDLLISLFEDHRDLVAKLSHSDLLCIPYIVACVSSHHYIWYLFSDETTVSEEAL